VNKANTVTNADITAVFDRVADLLEFTEANPFRIRAYRSAARTISSMIESLASLRENSTRTFTDIEGIGTDLSHKIEVLLETGSLPLLEELEASVPPGVFAIMRVPGLGPKKAKILFEKLQIESLESLENACREGRVATVRGFGEKTQQSILDNMAFAKSDQHQRLLWEDADGIMQDVLAYMKKSFAARTVEGAGSWRRGCETVGDLDLVVESDDPTTVMNHFAEWNGTTVVLLRGDTKMSIRGPRETQIDLRVVTHDSFGCALQYFTGSKEHNVLLRSRAREHNLTLNEYGVFDGFQASETSVPEKMSVNVIHAEKGKWIAGRTEEEVYKAIGLPWIPSEMREGRSEITLAEEGRLPRLVELSDVRGDLHMHTTATDGENTLEEMVQAAIERKLEYIAITDHGQRVTMARGLNAKRLLNQWGEIDRLNDSLSKHGKPAIVVLKGIEVDMLEKGGLDLPDNVLEQADWVVASLHYGQSQPREKITSRILEAISNPHVSVIGHPTGRLINRRQAYDVDMLTVIQSAAKYGTFLEINANPWRLDLNDIHAAAAQKAGVKLVISTDAHSTQGLRQMRHGILQARRASLASQDIANTRPLSELRTIMKKRTRIQ